jgi:glycosyltransferase involved in cell wall biosynthesis
LKEDHHDVFLFSIDPLLTKQDWLEKLNRFFAPIKSSRNLIAKYWSAQKQVRIFIKQTQPDLIHAHYLTNYGIVAALTNFHPLVATAWGSDIFEFPKQNVLNRALLKFVFRSSDAIISTSSTMKREMENYTSKEIQVIPFGINFSKYQHEKQPSNSFTIACFKRLGDVYGQDLLINAFAEANKRFPQLNLKLVLYGDGKLKSELQALVDRLSISQVVEFAGWVDPEVVPKRLAETQLCVYLSRRESFGVSLIEAMAAKVPLLVSKITAFEEVAGKDGTVFFCEPNSLESATAALCRAIGERANYSSMTEMAYAQAFKRFTLKQNISDQIALYQKTINKLKT